MLFGREKAGCWGGIAACNRIVATWESVKAATQVMRGFVAPARPDFVSGELGFADAGAAGAQLLARCFGGVKGRVLLVLDRADQLGMHVPVRCTHTQ